MRGKLFLSALVEILEQFQKVIGDGLLRDLVEHRANLTPDMSLQRWRHSFCIPLRGLGSVLTLALGRVYRHSPFGLLLVIAVHSGSFMAWLPIIAV
ncbi:MAG TPA: hypothetical protein VMW68_01620 [Methyloceanibacter sp.]|nr:hypothetical protein [Methyloceanibacter sp.]